MACLNLYWEDIRYSERQGVMARSHFWLMTTALHLYLEILNKRFYWYDNCI
jgi:hypothetical protein